MRKTGLCGVVIATLFGTAGLLQHPSHHKFKSTTSIMKTELVALGTSRGEPARLISDVGSRQAAASVTLLPYGFLRVTRNRARLRPRSPRTKRP